MADTLSPDVGTKRLGPYLSGLFAGLVGSCALLRLGAPRAGVALAALLVPALCATYLYDSGLARQLRDGVLLATLVTGAVAGLAVTRLAEDVLPSQSPLPGPPGVGFLLGWTIAVPLVQELTKVVPVLWLRGHTTASPSAAVAFGLASGAAFAGAETFVRYWPLLSGGQVPLDWLPTALDVAALAPLLQGACTALVASALWVPERLAVRRFAVGTWLALGVHVAFTAGSTLLRQVPVGEGLVTAVQASLVVLLLAYLGYLVRDGAAEPGTSQPSRMVASA